MLILLATLANMVLTLTGIAVTFLGLRAIADLRLKIPLALFRQAREKVYDYALEAQYYAN